MSLRFGASSGRLRSMRYISAKEYSILKNISLTTVYERMRDGRLPFVEREKIVKRIPWDDAKGEACQVELVAP